MEYRKIFWLTIALLIAAIASLACFIYAADIYGVREKVLLSGIPERTYHAITARQQEYDAAIFGSSVSENFKCSEVDRVFGVNSMKFTLQGGSVPERVFIWDYVCRQRPLKLMISDIADQTFAEAAGNFRIDRSWYDSNRVRLREYLSSDNLKSALYKVFCGIRNKTGRDDLYSWYRNFEFGEKRLARLYYQVDNSGRPARPDSLRIEDLRKNLEQSLLPSLRRNRLPDGRIIFFFPPYSILHYQPGTIDRRLEFKRVIMEELLTVEGLELYDFQADEGIVCDLGLYRDDIHFNEQVNSRIVGEFGSSRCRVTADRIDEFIERHRRLVKTYDYAATAAKLRQLVGR